MKAREEGREFFSAFMSAVSGDVVNYASEKKSIVLPVVPLGFLKILISQVTDIFSKEESMLALRAPIVVVGDLHGHLMDLYRILKTFGSPERTKYLFLGDIVDRGEFSVECIVIVYLMKLIWPKQVYIIRGNHEFAFLCGQCGFFSQLSDTYRDGDLFREFITSFSHMPLSALINNSSLCVHAGLSPATSSITQLCEIQKPFDIFGDSPLIDGLLWSDPSNSVEYFETSSRGAGYYFGKSATIDFMGPNMLKHIVRGHECVMGGVETHFDERVITVFSASNYCGLVKNQAGVLVYGANGEFEVKRMPPLPYLVRNHAMFRRGNAPNHMLPPKPPREPKEPKEPVSARIPKIPSISHLPPLKNAPGKTPRRGVAKPHK